MVRWVVTNTLQAQDSVLLQPNSVVTASFAIAYMAFVINNTRGGSNGGTLHTQGNDADITETTPSSWNPAQLVKAAPVVQGL